MTTVLQDARYAWRVLRKAPVTSGVAVLTLALGTGATSAIFAFVNATLLTPAAGVAEPGRLVTVGRTCSLRPGWSRPPSRRCAHPASTRCSSCGENRV